MGRARNSWGAPGHNSSEGGPGLDRSEGDLIQATDAGGRPGVVNLKGAYSIGLTHIFQKGLPGLMFDDVELSALPAPAELDQLYYIRVVDMDWKTRPEPYTITRDRQADGSWRNARVQTPLFTLKAPHLLIKETTNRIKIRILSRVK